MLLYIRKALAAAVLCAFAAAPAHALTDTYRQTFDSMIEGDTVDGSDSWIVQDPAQENAIAESGETAGGGGKALKIIGAEIDVDVSRPDEYGSLSPTWIEYVVKPSMGAEPREVPADGIAAVDFSSTGKIMVSDGSVWVNTNKEFSWNVWYRIILKLDFSTHTYDIYCEPANSPESAFVPEKQNLHFIDPNANSLSKIGFKGAYNADYQSDSLVDDVTVHFIDRFQFVTSPHTLVRGHSSGLITVQLQNANGVPQTAWRDIEVEMRSSTQTGEFSLDENDWIPINSVILPEGSQQVSFYYKDFEEGKPTISVNEFPDRGWTDATQEQKVVEEGEFFVVTADSTQTAGEPFAVRITAMDGQGGVDASYTGSVDLFAQYVSPETGTKTIAPAESSGFVNGMAELPLSYPDAGVMKIGVRDRIDTLKVGYSGDITFLPHSFDVSSDPVQVVGRDFLVSVKALDKDGHVTPNYKSLTKIEAVPQTPPSTTGGAFNPSELADAAFEGGEASLHTVYNRWGTIRIKAFDAGHPEKKGESQPVTFLPKKISVTVKPPTSSREFFYAAENMEVTISVLGHDDLPIENFEGALSITATPSFNFPAQHAFTASDKGQKKFVAAAGAAGKYKLKVEDVENNLTQESDEFEVKDATIVVSNTSSPVGATSVEIQLLDKDGKRIREENEMTVTIVVQEENENGSVFFSELGKPILFKKGVARIVLGDNEAETVTISARSKYGLKVQNGKVIFGRAGATGVGTLMLRESKD